MLIIVRPCFTPYLLIPLLCSIILSQTAHFTKSLSLDEDRRLNAQRFEETFYQKKNPSEVNGATVEPKKEPQGITEEAMLNYMVQNPDFLQKFKVLLGVGN